MFCLGSSILAHILSSTTASHVPSLHHLISAAAPAISRSRGFAVEDYLVDTCGLTRAQAHKASTKISHLKSPSRIDAVLAYLAGLGLPTADVARDPQLLCASVERTLAPNVAGLTALGLSRAEIAHLVLLRPSKFRLRSIISDLQYYLPIFGSFDNLLRALKFNDSLLTCNLERIVKPNVAILRECGLADCDIAMLGMAVPRMLTVDSERLRAMVAHAQGVGVPVGSRMFKHALSAVAFLSEKIAARVEFLKKTCRWSDSKVGIAVSKSPTLLSSSEDKLQRASEFLISEVGLVPAYIAHQPAMLLYSLEGRLKPRYYVLKFLKENGFRDRDLCYYSVVTVTCATIFVEKYICPHKEAAPHLADDYADACRGQVPTRFIFA